MIMLISWRSTFKQKFWIFFVGILLVKDTSFRPLTSAYWVWAGRRLDSAPPGASLYLYQGIVRQKGSRQFLQVGGLAPHPAKLKPLFLVWRLETIALNQSLLPIILRRINAWEKHGALIQGIQLDYDSPTLRLSEYQQFLRDFRRQLPSAYQLSITGLSDWLNAPSSVLENFKEIVDEVVFQLYWRQNLLEEAPHYLAKSRFLRFPFKLGLLDCRNHTCPSLQSLRGNLYYQGVVYFLQ